MRHAHRAAVQLFTKALDVLNALPHIPERDHQELTLLLALGTPLTTTKGWGTAEVKRIYDRAQSLRRYVQVPVLRNVALMGLWAYHFTRAELPTASGLAQQLLTAAQEFDFEPLLFGARLELGARS